jgi:hypothetical protein
MDALTVFDEDPRWRYDGRSLRAGCEFCLEAGILVPGGGTTECPGCRALRCAACASPCRGCGLLARLLGVAAGSSEDSSDAGAKTFHIVRTFGTARDVLLAPGRLVMRVLGDSRRHGYFSRAAPFVLKRVFEHTGIARLDWPVVAHARAGPTWRAVRDTAADEIAWLLPLPMGIEVRFRPPTSAGPPPRPMAVPDQGPWSLPPPWREPDGGPPTLVSSTMACPHCAETPGSYRRLSDGGLVCRSCGRSFDAGLLGPVT